jgi:glucose-6-phosphate 1-dehydrogenase
MHQENKISRKRKTDQRISPFYVVVFGGDGDLAQRKIYPALFFRFADGQLGENFEVVAISWSGKDEVQFKKQVKEFILLSIEDDPSGFQNKIDEFLTHFKVLKISEHHPSQYNELKNELQKNPDYQIVYYFSTPSSAYGDISRALKSSGLITKQSKVVLEKPLGNSLETARQINFQIGEAFSEKQVYRIDHYLGKETVQNLMVLRFANHLFEIAWNGQNIDNVQITVSENLGVENRASYYDRSGALLDMVQNHLLQLLCLVGMEPPNALDPDSVRNEKLKVLHALRPFTTESVITDSVKGQYTRGKVNGKEVNSYLEDIGKYDSKTETFVALKVFVDNWRWKGVPFYLRTGKRMKKRYSEIVINFKSVRHNIFQSDESVPNNRLIIRLQPQERIELVQMTKIPGPGGYRYKPISLKLDFMDSFDERLPEAYERLLVDVLRGNQTLFMRQDELEASWEWIESIANNWKAVDKTNILYESGSWGPGDQILEEGDDWITKDESKHH